VNTPPKPLVIAIDGPSGTGKSSVSKAVAQRLDLAYLDTGAMYRALTWWCVQQGVDLEDQPAVTRAAKDLPLQMGTDPSSPSVQVGGVLIDEAIRATAISESVSKVATNLGVRDELCRRQRALIAESVEAAGGVVAEGRDITTVVAPDAHVRILLSANQEARLARRAKQLHGEAATPRSLPSMTRSCAVTRTTRRFHSSCTQLPASRWWTPQTLSSTSPWKQCWM